MTPKQKIKWIIIADQRIQDGLDPLEITEDNVDDIFDCACRQDALSEFRCNGTRTGLLAPHSRHYEAQSVAAQAPDGSWVGWTYWFGGGKWGDPEAIDWLDEAYDLNYVEEQKMTTVRTFTAA